MEVVQEVVQEGFQESVEKLVRGFSVVVQRQNTKHILLHENFCLAQPFLCPRLIYTTATACGSESIAGRALGDPAAPERGGVPGFLCVLSPSVAA